MLISSIVVPLVIRPSDLRFFPVVPWLGPPLVFAFGLAFVSFPNTESEFTTIVSVKFDVVNFGPNVSLPDPDDSFVCLDESCFMTLFILPSDGETAFNLAGCTIGFVWDEITFSVFVSCPDLWLVEVFCGVSSLFVELLLLLLLFFDDFDLDDDDVGNDNSLSWPFVEFVTLLVLLLCFSLSLELLDDEVLLPEPKPLLEDVVVADKWLLVELFEELCALAMLLLLLELNEVLPLFDALLDLRCFDGRSLWRDDVPLSVSFSGDDGASLEFSAWLIGLYGGMGFTFPPFFYNRK